MAETFVERFPFSHCFHSAFPRYREQKVSGNLFFIIIIYE
jgi:hypothetical protein